jgi:hypothetical protein
MEFDRYRGALLVVYSHRHRVHSDCAVYRTYCGALVDRPETPGLAISHPRAALGQVRQLEQRRRKRNARKDRSDAYRVADEDLADEAQPLLDTSETDSPFDADEVDTAEPSIFELGASDERSAAELWLRIFELERLFTVHLRSVTGRDMYEVLEKTYGYEYRGSESSDADSLAGKVAAKLKTTELLTLLDQLTGGKDEVPHKRMRRAWAALIAGKVPTEVSARIFKRATKLKDAKWTHLLCRGRSAIDRRNFMRLWIWVP